VLLSKEVSGEMAERSQNAQSREVTHFDTVVRMLDGLQDRWLQTEPLDGRFKGGLSNDPELFMRPHGAV
jgi:hypothetical protein